MIGMKIWSFLWSNGENLVPLSSLDQMRKTIAYKTTCPFTEQAVVA